MCHFQDPKTESFKITRAENRNVLEDGKIELESTVSMILQQKSILYDAKFATEKPMAIAMTSVSSSGFETPRVTSSIQIQDENDTNGKDHHTIKGPSEEKFGFQPSPSPNQVENRGIQQIFLCMYEYNFFIVFK